MIHVCYGLYDKFGRYSKFTRTSMLSLFNNTKFEVTVHILHDNTLTAENKNKLQGVAENFNQQVKFYNVEELCADKLSEILENIPSVTNSVYSIATFYRFLIPDLIAEEKIIYLDSDTIINLDINELWSVELGEKIFAVIPEKSNGVPAEKFLTLCIDGLVKPENYFNAGVLLINLNRFRQESEKIIDGMKFISANPRYEFFDQDILNYCFSEQTVRLPNKFNFHVAYARDRGETSPEEKICHYVGNSANFDMRDNFSKLWMENFLKTAWFNTEVIYRIYECIQELEVQSRNKIVEISAVMSGKQRIFFAELNNFAALKNIFKIQRTEEIIDGTKPDAIKILLQKMNELRGAGFFILLVHDFDALKNFLTAENFIEGADFIDASEFLSSAHGKKPLDTYFLIRAI